MLLSKFAAQIAWASEQVLDTTIVLCAMLTRAETETAAAASRSMRTIVIGELRGRTVVTGVRGSRSMDPPRTGLN
jgi:hypothetical protein